jgi:uncharacterized membrane protein
MTRLGHRLLAIGIAGLGLLSLIFDDFALVWQPVPDAVPGRRILAYVSGALLLVCGLGMLWKRTAPKATGLLASFVTLWLALLQVPRVARAPGDEGMWLGFGENLLLVTGSWTLFILCSRDQGGRRSAAGDAALRAARVVYALALPVIGLSHFVYTQATVSMVPAWLPFRIGFAYLTGAGHAAAGIGILFGVARRLAATLEALMLSTFVLLLHLPGVIAAPNSRLQWTMLFVASAFTGCAWGIAGALGRESKAPP